MHLAFATSMSRSMITAEPEIHLKVELCEHSRGGPFPADDHPSAVRGPGPSQAMTGPSINQARADEFSSLRLKELRPFSSVTQT